MNADDRAKRWDYRGLLIALAIVVLFGAPRLAGLPRETPWHDEVLSLRYMNAASLGEYLELVLGNDPAVRPFPIYFVAQYLWTQWAGPSVISLRLFSVACSLGALILLMAIARRLYDRPAAWVAGALFAVALPHIYFAQEIRFYALVTLLVTASNYLFVRAIQDGRRRWWVGHGIVNAVMLWTHVYGPLIWLVQGLFLLMFRRRQPSLLVTWFAAHALMCAVFAAQLYAMDYVIRDAYVDQATPTYRELLNAFNIYAGGRFSKLNPAAYLPTGLSLGRFLTVALALLTVSLGVLTYHDRRRSDPQSADHDRTANTEAYVFLLMWLVIPPVFLFLVSQVWKPLFIYRYTLYGSLALYIIAGKALTSLSNTPARSFLAALFIVAFANQLTVLGQPFRPDYRAAHAYIQSHAPPGGTVYVLKTLNGIPFHYASGLPAERVAVYEGLGELYDALSEDLQAGNVAWLLLWQWEDFASIEAYLDEQGFAYRRREFGGIPSLVLYRVEAARSERGRVAYVRSMEPAGILTDRFSAVAGSPDPATPPTAGLQRPALRVCCGSQTTLCPPCSLWFKKSSCPSHPSW